MMRLDNRAVASQPPLTRRRLVQTAGAAAVTASIGPFFHVRPAKAAKTLKILQWHHFVLGYDEWFNGTYIKEWGAANDTEVIVQNVGVPALNPRAATEVAAQKGHDLFMFLWPPPAFEEHVIDHSDVYQECESRYGKPIDLAIQSTYNPRTHKFFGFSDSFVPDPVNYRKDLWDEIGMVPDTWDDVRQGGRRIKRKHGIPIGIGLSAEIDTAMAMRSIMYAFGASVQDAQANLILDSKETLNAVQYVKALYQEAMTPEVLTWDSASNNNFMLAGKGSLALNAISITRTGENKKIPVAKHIGLAKAPRGPVRRIGVEHIMSVYVIWKFAENIEGAKQFLVDYVGNFRQGFLAGELYNFPCFPSVVPDIQERIAHDSKADPPTKYKVLDDVLDWTTNIGYPGHANAAIDEIFSTWLLNAMFAKAATGADSPKRAIEVASAECKRIWAKWRDKGLI